MAYLGLRQAQQLSTALAPLYADPQADYPYERLSKVVSDLLGAELTCFDIFDPAGNMSSMGDNAPSLFTPLMLRRLAEHVQEHPLFRPIFVEKDVSPLKISDLCSSQQFYKTRLFNEFYRPIAITHQLVVGLDLPGNGFATCSLSRSRRDFTETERVLLAFVQPHLAALLRLAQPAPLNQLHLPEGLGITSREAEILRFLAHGQPDKVIAQQCGISPRTVQVHLHRIYAKLGVDNRTAAVVLLKK